METLVRPSWLKKKIEFDASRSMSTLLNSLDLNTVCREAMCPNIAECFKRQHATFLILGKSCSRSCKFCHVEKSKTGPVDADEPRRIAFAVKKLRLKHVVITSVTRDDLPDGGASAFIATVAEIRGLSPYCAIELLIPDLKGDLESVKNISQSKPDIIGHNVETVPRLYHLRPGADYRRSLKVLTQIKKTNENIRTKSAIMLGLGEREDELRSVLEDLRKAGCDFLALGQYLRPSLQNAEVAAYIAPEKFDEYKSLALSLGFRHVESGPYVRSSYRAADYLVIGD